MSRFSEGDSVYVSTFGRPYTRATVTKVARKYITVDGTRFDKFTGDMAGEYTGDVRTESEHRDAERRSDAMNALHNAGIILAMRNPLTTDQLERILTIVHADDRIAAEEDRDRLAARVAELEGSLCRANELLAHPLVTMPQPGTVRDLALEIESTLATLKQIRPKTEVSAGE